MYSRGLGRLFVPCQAYGLRENIAWLPFLFPYRSHTICNFGMDGKRLNGDFTFQDDLAFQAGLAGLLGGGAEHCLCAGAYVFGYIPAGRSA